MLFQSQNTPRGKLNGPGLTFLKSLSHDLLISGAHYMWESFLFFSPIDKEDKDRQCCEFSFPPVIDEVNPVTRSQIIFLLIRLLNFKAPESSIQSSRCNHTLRHRVAVHPSA